MNMIKPLFFSLAYLLIITAAYAREVANITFPDSMQVANTKLVLNGAGLRTKFFVKVYAGALYLKNKSNRVEGILDDNNAKRIIMHFIHDEVNKEKLTSAWIDGFKNNQDEKTYKSLVARLQTFNSYFSNLRKGDRVILDYFPSQGTQVTIKDEVKGMIPGQDFQRALLSVWLGDDPADWSLKDAMLGGD